MPKKHARKALSPPGVGRNPSRRHLLRWLIVSLVMGVVVALGVHFARRGVLAEPPVISTTGFEPVVAAQIEKTLAEVRANPRSDSAWGKLGMVLQAYEFTTEARACFAQAERLNAKDARWLYLHALLLRQHDGAAAIAKLRRAIGLSAAQSDAPRLLLAQSLFEAGRFDEAENHFKQLLDENVNHAPARLGLAELSNTRGRLEESRQMLQVCLTNAVTAKRAHTLLGQVERQLGHTAAAEAAIRAAAFLPLDRSWPDPFSDEAAQYHIGRKAWADQGQRLLEQQRHEEARRVIERLLKEYSAAPEGWLLLGRLHMRQNNCVGAEQAFRQHLQREPDSVNGHAQLGLALLCLERYADAAAILQRAVQLKPDFGKGHFNLGFAQARAGRASEAIASFRSAIRFSPEFVDAYITLADLLIQTGGREEALVLLRQAQQLSPTDDRVQILMQRAQR